MRRRDALARFGGLVLMSLRLAGTAPVSVHAEPEPRASDGRSLSGEPPATQALDVGTDLQPPIGLAVDGLGRVYVLNGVRLLVQRFLPSGEPDVAWNRSGPNYDPLQIVPASIQLAVAPQDRLYLITSEWRTMSTRIQVLDASGQEVLTLGPYHQVDLSPGPMAVDADGTMYVAAIGRGTATIVQVSPTGELGPRWPIPLGTDVPSALAIDQLGRIYTSQWNKGRVDRFSPGGELVREWAPAGRTPDDTFHPGGLVVARDGSIFVNDFTRLDVWRPDTAPWSSFALAHQNAQAGESPSAGHWRAQPGPPPSNRQRVAPYGSFVATAYAVTGAIA